MSSNVSRWPGGRKTSTNRLDGDREVLDRTTRSEQRRVDQARRLRELIEKRSRDSTSDSDVDTPIIQDVRASPSNPAKGRQMAHRTQSPSAGSRDVPETLFQGQSAAGNARQHVGHHYNNTYNHSSHYYSIRQRRSDETLREGQRDTTLLTAASAGHTPRVAYLLRLGADVDHSDDDGFTALHLAALRGYLDTVDTLVQEGANIDAQSLDCGTPLHLAALKGHAKVVQSLLDHRANANARSRLLGRPLHCSCFHGSLACTDALLAAGADATASARVMIEAICDIAAARPEGKDYEVCECQPLIMSTIEEHTELFDSLLNSGVEIDRMFSRWVSKGTASFESPGLDFTGFAERLTALHAAVIKPSPKCCLALLERKAYVDAPDIAGRSPLIVACSSGTFECMALLLRFNASIDLADNHGNSALSYAVVNREGFDAAELLIKHGASLEWVSSGNRSLLHFAVEFGSVETTALLLDSGAPQRIQDSRHETPRDLARRVQRRPDKDKDRFDIIKLNLLNMANQGESSNFLRVARSWLAYHDQRARQYMIKVDGEV